MSVPWIPALFLAPLALGVFALAAENPTGCPAANHGLPRPQRLAIYYGYPSLLNGSSGDYSRAAAALLQYDAVVLGDGLELLDVQPSRRPPGPGPVEHQNTRRLIELLRNQHKTVFGYVDLGKSQMLAMEEMKRRARLWQEMGARGIFLDEAGYDFGVTRARQNEIISFIHSLGLGAFVNAFEPDDAFSPAAIPLNGAGGGNPRGETAVLGNGDFFLLESFLVRNGQFDRTTAGAERIARAVGHRQKYGTRIFATTTIAVAQTFSQAQFNYAYAGAVLWGLDGFGWGELDFGARDNLLPWRGCPEWQSADLGTRFTSAVRQEGHSYIRATDRGRIRLDFQGAASSFERVSP